MKVYFNANGTINRIPADDTKFFQNSGNNQSIYLYGLPEGQEVLVTFTRNDRVKFGPYGANYGTDPEDVACVICPVPIEVFEIDGGLKISLVAQHEEVVEIEGVTTIELVRHAYAQVGLTVYPNDAVVVP